MRQRWWVAALRWPLWSWPRLATTVLAVLALAWAAGQLQAVLAAGPAPANSASPASTAGTANTASTASAAGTASAASTASAAQPGGGFGTLPGSADAAFPASGQAFGSAAASGRVAPGTAPSRPAPAGGREPAAVAARRFVIAWARPDLPAAQWFSGLSGLCTPRLSALLAQTDPGRVPASRVLDPASTAGPDPTPAAVGSAVEVAVATDAGRIRVREVATRTGWLADAVAPDAQPPAGAASAATSGG